VKSRPKKPAKKAVSSSSAASNMVLKDASRHLMNTYKRSDMIFTHGRGCYVFDQNGKKYLDFLGGIAVNALGYSYPDLVKTIRREAGRAVHVSNLFHNPFQGPLAAKLAKWSGMDRAFFTNSGSEAVEGALKLARIAAKKKPGGATKTRFLALEHSFHGRTFGALSITHPLKYREPFEPLVPGVEFVRLNDVADLEAKFTDEVCAVIIEPIQGEGGIYPISNEFWKRARELATTAPRLSPMKFSAAWGAQGKSSRTSASTGCRTSSSSPNRSRAGFRLARFWRARNLPHPFRPACMAPRLAADR
jgi:acetylornithine aminotransferase/acetylornithine/N-succinyldiaminopimelate aminotransferase